MKRSLEFGSGSLDSYVPFEFLRQTPTTSKAAPAIRVLFFASAEKSGRIGTDNLVPGGRSVAHNVFISSGSTKKRPVVGGWFNYVCSKGSKAITRASGMISQTGVVAG